MCTHAEWNFNSQATKERATGICFSAFINKIMFEVCMKMKIATTTEMEISEGLLMDFKIAESKNICKVSKRDLL